MGHRRYLPLNHHYRDKKKAFDGDKEQGVAPLPLSGQQILKEVEKIDFKYGKMQKNKKVSGCFQRKSIFFVSLTRKIYLFDIVWMSCI